MKNGIAANATAENITVTPELKNMSKVSNKTKESGKVEYPTTAREVQKRMENIDHQNAFKVNLRPPEPQSTSYYDDIKKNVTVAAPVVAANATANVTANSTALTVGNKTLSQMPVSLAQIWPLKPTGLEPPPRDYQYDEHALYA